MIKKVIALFALIASMAWSISAQDFQDKQVRDFLISVGEI